MSRRSSPTQPREGTPEGTPQRDGDHAPRESPVPRLLGEIGILIGVFAIVVAVAELAGAANLGVAFGIGQIAFAIVLVFLLVKR